VREKGRTASEQQHNHHNIITISNQQAAAIMHHHDSSSSQHSLWKHTVSTTTLYGKLARILHTLVVSLLLGSSLWSVIFPFSEGTNCALEPFQEDPYITRFLQGLIQLVNWWGVGFFVQSFGCTVKNAVMLVGVLAGASCINSHMTTSLLELDPNRISEGCFSGLVLFVVIVCAIEGLVLVLMACEQVCHTNRPTGGRHDVQQQHGSPTEKQSLVT